MKHVVIRVDHTETYNDFRFALKYEQHQRLHVGAASVESLQYVHATHGSPALKQLRYSLQLWAHHSIVLTACNHLIELCLSKAFKRMHVQVSAAGGSSHRCQSCL